MLLPLNIPLLRRAQASILNPENLFDMQNWHFCIAGHICRAAGLDVEKIPTADIANRAIALAGAHAADLYPLFVAPGSWSSRQMAAMSLDAFIEVYKTRMLEAARRCSALEPAAQSRRARAESTEHQEEPEEELELVTA